MKLCSATLKGEGRLALITYVAEIGSANSSHASAYQKRVYQTGII